MGVREEELISLGLEGFADLYGRCAYCGGRAQVGVDHEVPLSAGGSDDFWNVVPSCRSCNSSKGAREMRPWLIKKYGAAGTLRFSEYVAWREAWLTRESVPVILALAGLILCNPYPQEKKPVPL